MKIEKSAYDTSNYLNNIYYYDNARSSMTDLLQSMVNKNIINKIFLPGYIGWSPKEGSGIFDAVKDITNLKCIYYRMNSDLSINLEDLTRKIENENKYIVLIVNYFGFRDINYSYICKTIKANHGLILEDNAHGFFTYYNAGKCLADATFFSYHKMFPVANGGGMIILTEVLKKSNLIKGKLYLRDFCEWHYDIKGISKKRIANYKCLERLLKQRMLSEVVQPLERDLQLSLGEVPQTFPVVIKKGNRDAIYEYMNTCGFGVVSLYHTLINELQTPEYEEAYELSKHILNLPIHQDVNSKQYKEMVNLLYEACLETDINNEGTRC